MLCFGQERSCVVAGGSVLQGTFETLSLPEVLGLLASARKSGALWLEAGPIAGVVHLEDGHCHATVAGELVGPVDTGPELLARLVDLCFACMCQESGSFRFAADDPSPWWCSEPVELSDALVEVDRLLKQWREILRIIPSLECRPCLLDALEVDELVIDRERWALLVAIDSRRTVRELVARSSRPVIDVCHMLCEWVEAGAIGVIDPAAAHAPEVVAPEPELLETGPFAPEAVEPEPGTPEPDPPEPDNYVPEPEEYQPEPIEDAPEVAETGFVDTALAEGAPEPDPSPPAAPAPELAQPESAPAVNGVNGDRGEYVEAAPLVEVGAPAGAAPGDPSAGSETTDKGAFLRLFSGLRES